MVQVRVSSRLLLPLEAGDKAWFGGEGVSQGYDQGSSTVVWFFDGNKKGGHQERNTVHKRDGEQKQGVEKVWQKAIWWLFE